jgi:hypothetical protein
MATPNAAVTGTRHASGAASDLARFVAALVLAGGIATLPACAGDDDDDTQPATTTTTTTGEPGDLGCPIGFVKQGEDCVVESETTGGITLPDDDDDTQTTGAETTGETADSDETDGADDTGETTDTADTSNDEETTGADETATDTAGETDDSGEETDGAAEDTGPFSGVDTGASELVGYDNVTACDTAKAVFVTRVVDVANSNAVTKYITQEGEVYAAWGGDEAILTAVPVGESANNTPTTKPGNFRAWFYSGSATGRFDIKTVTDAADYTPGAPTTGAGFRLVLANNPICGAKSKTNLSVKNLTRSGGTVTGGTFGFTQSCLDDQDAVVKTVSGCFKIKSKAPVDGCAACGTGTFCARNVNNEVTCAPAPLPTGCGDTTGLLTAAVTAMGGNCPSRVAEGRRTGPANTLAVAWKATLDGPVASGVVVDNWGTAYAVTTEGTVSAVLSSGTPFWDFYTLGLIDNTAPLLTADGRLIVGSTDGFLYSLSREGARQWYQALGGPLAGDINVNAAGNLLVTAGTRAATSALVQVIEPDGTRVAKTERFALSPGGVAVTPSGTIAFGTTKGEVGELDPLTMELADTWDSLGAASAGITAGPTAHPDGLIVVAAGNVVEVWDAGARQATITLTGKVSGRPAVTASGNLVITDAGGWVSMYDPFGAPVWSKNFGDPILAGATIDSSGNIYVATTAPVGSSEAKLYSLRPADGSTQASLTIEGGLRGGSPAIGNDGRLYFGTEAGFLYAVSVAP